MAEENRMTDSLPNGCPAENANAGETGDPDSRKNIESPAAVAEATTSNSLEGILPESAEENKSKHDDPSVSADPEEKRPVEAPTADAPAETNSDETLSRSDEPDSRRGERLEEVEDGISPIPEAGKTAKDVSADEKKVNDSLRSEDKSSCAEVETAETLKTATKSVVDTEVPEPTDKLEKNSPSSKTSDKSVARGEEENVKMNRQVTTAETVGKSKEGSAASDRVKNNEKDDDQLGGEKQQVEDEQEQEREEEEEVEEEEDGDEPREEMMNEEDVEEEEEEEEEEEQEEEEEEEEVEEEDDEDEDEDENEQLELGIVGPPTAVSELINEEELRCAESVLLTEDGGGAESVQDHVAEWVQNSANNKLDQEEENEDDRLEMDVPRPADQELRPNADDREKSTEPSATRKSKRVVSNIIKRSIKCLNKMHAMDTSAAVKSAEKGMKKAEIKMGQKQNTTVAEKEAKELQRRNAAEVESSVLSRNHRDRRNHQSHPNHRRNGDEHQEESEVAPGSYGVKKEPASEPETDPEPERDAVPKLRKRAGGTERLKNVKPDRESKKRRSTDEIQNSNGGSKRACLEQREELISSLVGGEKVTTEELTVRAEQLRAELQALDQLARAKEKEWNEILSMRKLKEEAYLRIERRRQVVGFMEGNGQLNEASSALPPAGISLEQEWDNAKEKSNSTEATLSDKSITRSQVTSKQNENGQKESSDGQNSENRQIGEGRQGPMVDVRTIIADYRLRHPETVPRRSRRMRNSVNVGLGAGGAVVETGHIGADSRPSSTDSCKSSSNPTDPGNSMSFKDVLVQFAKLSQQQGEAVKTPQNYPDVTLHPVLPSSAAPQAATTTIQQTGSLLHGILTKSQSPRPTTFSPTLARLLTAPERDRCNPIATSTPQQATATQHLLQAYQGTNPVSISDLLSSSKARTEITITPVVNTPTPQSHSNSLIHVEDIEEETTVIEERGGRSSSARDDSPPRCQGCQDRAAQFVCAGCGNQWYCSRECQVSAWDEHSEVCSG